MLAQHQLEERGRQLVMLNIGIGGIDGDGTVLQALDEFHEMPPLRLRVAAVLFDQAGAEQPANTEAHQKIG